MDKTFPVLVVDDDVVSRTLTEKYLAKAGFEVVTASNGSQALELFDQTFFPILITDWMMPQIDGPQLCRLIREKKTDGYVFIILITAKDSKNDIISGLESGADDYLTKPIHPAELVARINTGIRILKLEKSLMKANEEIRMLSTVDPLTRSYNRSYLNERFPQEISRAQRYAHPLSVILADIDHFKQVNDSYGHQAGDEVLRDFTKCLKNQIRKRIDWIVRYGGEEFLIILPETACQGAIQLAERLRASVAERRFQVCGTSLNITASFGGACIIPNEERTYKISMAELINQVDAQLYRCKNSGRNRVSVVPFEYGMI